mgnify:CR=1 FL=1
MGMPPGGHPAHPGSYESYMYGSGQWGSSSGGGNYVQPPAALPIEVMVPTAPRPSDGGMVLAVLVNLAPDSVRLIWTDNGDLYLAGAGSRSRCLLTEHNGVWTLATSWGSAVLDDHIDQIRAHVESLGGELNAAVIVPSQPTSAQARASKPNRRRRWFGSNR